MTQKNSMPRGGIAGFVIIRYTDTYIGTDRQEEPMNELKQRIRTYWNRRSRGFSAVRRRELASSDAAAWQNYIKGLLPQGRRLQILDVGTGPGFLAIILADLGHMVTAIDSSSGMIREAWGNADEYRADNIEFYVGDAQALPFAENSFDVIISRNLTWNLPDVAAAYADWYRMLKPGGLLLNFDSNYGPVRFDATAKETENIHHDLDTQLLLECETLKDALAISRECRPVWDLQRVRAIGFTDCAVTPDIREAVHTSDEMKYDSEAVFCLRARKSTAGKAGTVSA